MGFGLMFCLWANSDGKFLLAGLGMSFDYTRINLEALASLPLKCACPDKEKSESLKRMLLDYITDGRVISVELDGKVYDLKERKP